MRWLLRIQQTSNITRGGPLHVRLRESRVQRHPPRCKPTPRNMTYGDHGDDDDDGDDGDDADDADDDGDDDDKDDDDDDADDEDGDE
eukprot:4143330-Karenia_brevis.AAC.1